MAKKISERAQLLLYFVDDSTIRDWGTGELKRYFVPGFGMYHYFNNGKSDFTYISGSGDANILKSLERRGYIEKQPAADYSYALTEEGLQFVVENKIREKFN